MTQRSMILNPAFKHSSAVRVFSQHPWSSGFEPSTRTRDDPSIEGDQKFKGHPELPGDFKASVDNKR